MASTGFLREDFKEGDPVRKLCSATQARRIARILNSIEGVGCIIERNFGQEGLGWKIVIPEGGPNVPKPDTSGYSTTKNPDGRKTLEKNPQPKDGDTDSHKSEWQLRNVQHVLKGSSSVPFFVSESTMQGAVPDKIVGELYWAQPDASRYDDGTLPAYKSIEIVNTYSDTTKGKWSFGVYGFTGSAACSVPYSTHSLTPHNDKELTWRVPVSIDGNPYPDNATIPPYGTVTYVSGLVESPSYNSFATISAKTKTATVVNGTINFGTTETQLAAIRAEVYLSPVDVNATAKHDSLSDTAASALHDYRFLHRAGRGYDKYNAPSGANHCESIANNDTGKNAINFSTGVLLNASGQTSVAYGSTYALYNGATLTVDWKNAELYGRWSLGKVYGSADLWGAEVRVGAYDYSGFIVYNSAGYEILKTYMDTDSLPRTSVRGLRICARDSNSIYFDLEVSDGVLIVRDHTGVNCGEFRRSL
jgi:hypothetical protein